MGAADDLSVGALENAAPNGETGLAPQPSGLTLASADQIDAQEPAATPSLVTPPGVPIALSDQPDVVPPVSPASYRPYSWAVQSWLSLPKRGGWTAPIIILTVGAVLLICGGSGIALFLHAQGKGLFAAHSTATLMPAATSTPIDYVIYQNSLTSKASGWYDADQCTFQRDGYHVRNDYVCFAPVGQKEDVDVSIDAKQIGGTTVAFYGIAVRYLPSSPGNLESLYAFGIDSAGDWAFRKVVGGQQEVFLAHGSNRAIKTGLNVTNRLRVRAYVGLFDLFVNGTQVGHIDDSRFTNGYAGLSGYLGPDVPYGCEAVFTNIVIADLGGP